MTIEKDLNQDKVVDSNASGEELDEESEKNREILLILLLGIELALENPKNLKRMQQIWSFHDPAYKKWLENQIKVSP